MERFRKYPVLAWRTDLICKCGGIMYFYESVRVPVVHGDWHELAHNHKCSQCNEVESVNEKFPKLDFRLESQINEPIKHTPNGNKASISIETNKESETSG